MQYVTLPIKVVSNMDITHFFIPLPLTYISIIINLRLIDRYLSTISTVAVNSSSNYLWFPLLLFVCMYPQHSTTMNPAGEINLTSTLSPGLVPKRVYTQDSSWVTCTEVSILA